MAGTHRENMADTLTREDAPDDLEQAVAEAQKVAGRKRTSAISPLPQRLRT